MTYSQWLLGTPTSPRRCGHLKSIYNLNTKGDTRDRVLYLMNYGEGFELPILGVEW
jgi:hypothetical protein